MNIRLTHFIEYFIEYYLEKCLTYTNHTKYQMKNCKKNHKHPGTLRSNAEESHSLVMFWDGTTEIAFTEALIDYKGKVGTLILNLAEESSGSKTCDKC